MQSENVHQTVVGTAPAVLSSSTPDASTSSDSPGFPQQLKTRVFDLLDPLVMSSAYKRLHRKAVVVLAWWALSYLVVLWAPSWPFAILGVASLALSMVAVGFNIQHDANHNAFFDTHGRKRLSFLNRFAGWSLHLLGADSKRWIEGHVHQHHVAPNVVGSDYDIQLSPFARLAPSQPRHFWHVYQHLYVWFIYAFTSTGLIVGDVVGTVQESVSGDRHGHRPSLLDYVKMAGPKLLFLLLMVGVPLRFHSWWSVLLGACAVMAFTGVIIGVVFQLAHVVEETEFSQIGSRPRVSWQEWQIRASADFCQGSGWWNRLVTWFCGGLNYQTEHHLFPGLPHPLYPVIASTVSDVCTDFGISYRVQPSFRAAVSSHYRHLRAMGRASS